MQTTGKNKRRQLTVQDSHHNLELTVDSAEEIDFVRWCCEAVKLGRILDFEYQPESFVLFNQVSFEDVAGKTKCLFREHTYQCDFILKFSPKSCPELAKEMRVPKAHANDDVFSAYIDIKGTFNRTGRSFSIDRKWVWAKYNVYINEIVPVKFFKKFGCPEDSRLTEKTKKERSCYKGFPSVATAKL